MTSTNYVFGVFKVRVEEDTWGSVHNGVCQLQDQAGEVRLHYFLCRNSLEMNVNPQDRATAVISKHHKIAFITTCH